MCATVAVPCRPHKSNVAVVGKTHRIPKVFISQGARVCEFFKKGNASGQGHALRKQLKQCGESDAEKVSHKGTFLWILQAQWHK